MSTVRPSVIVALWSLAFAIASAQAGDLGPEPASSSWLELHSNLNLSPPELEAIYSPEEIAELINRDIEEVRVEGARLEAATDPVVAPIPEGLEAVIWSVPNPAQAWHIFMPVPSDAIDSLTVRLDAEHSQPTALPARDPAMFP
jgi:hypothetical protein